MDGRLPELGIPLEKLWRCDRLRVILSNTKVKQPPTYSDVLSIPESMIMIILELLKCQWWSSYWLCFSKVITNCNMLFIFL